MHEPPARRESGLMGQSTPWPKSAASGPVTRTVEIVSGVLPVFVSVTDCTSDLVPAGRSPKVSEVLLSVTSGPAPDNDADPSGTSRLMESAAAITTAATEEVTRRFAHAPDQLPMPNIALPVWDLCFAAPAGQLQGQREPAR